MSVVVIADLKLQFILANPVGREGYMI